MTNLKKNINTYEKNNFFRVCITTGSIIVGLVCIGTAYALLKSPEVPKKKVIKAMSREAKTEYLVSDNFAKLDDEKKSEVIKDMSGSADRRGMMRSMSSLSEEDRKKMFNNMRPVMQKMMKERLDKFFAMSQEERNKELDKMISRMDQMRANHEAGAPGGGNIEQRMSRMLEESDSDTRARISEFIKEMRARRAAAGK